MAHIITAWLIVFVVRLCLILLGWNLGVVEVCPGVKSVGLYHAFLLNLMFAGFSTRMGGGE